MYLCSKYHVTQGQKLKKRNNNEEIRKIFSCRCTSCNVGF